MGELRELTAQIAAGLRANGVTSGDRVVAYMPNIPETTAAFLACASIGAVWSSCSPDFGVPSVIDRFAQIEPKVLLTVDGYTYGGKQIDRRADIAVLEAALAERPALLRAALPRREGNWADLIQPGEPDVRAAALRPSALGPLFIGHDRSSRKRSCTVRAGSWSSI